MAQEKEDLVAVPENLELQNYEPGTKIILELKSGDLYDGIFIKGTNGPNARILLNNVCQFPLAYELKDDPSWYYAIEIRSIRVLPNDDEMEDEQNNAAGLPITGICSSEFEHWRALSVNYQYIPILDKTFFDCLKEIYKQETIAVLGLGSEIGRYRWSAISMMVIATRGKIYLFDTKLTVRRFFDEGLKDLLESKTILKVVHNSRQLADCLYNRHWGVKLENVFDTQIADYFITSKKSMPEKLRGFGVCADKHLNLPAIMFENTDLGKAQPEEIFTQRPCSDRIKLFASISAAYLIPLRNILRAKMMDGFTKTCSVYSNVMRTASPSCRTNMFKSIPEPFKKYVEENDVFLNC